MDSTSGYVLTVATSANTLTIKMRCLVRRIKSAFVEHEPISVTKTEQMFELEAYSH